MAYKYTNFSHKKKCYAKATLRHTAEFNMQGMFSVYLNLPQEVQACSGLDLLSVDKEHKRVEHQDHHCLQPQCHAWPHFSKPHSVVKYMFNSHHHNTSTHFSSPSIKLAPKMKTSHILTGSNWNDCIYMTRHDQFRINEQGFLLSHCRAYHL